ncbi:MAG: hypothetical protein AAGA99_19685 [Actinomycetota bacterium]
MFAFLLTLLAVGLLAWPLLRGRAQRLRKVTGSDRERFATAYWSALRAHSAGLRDSDLQDAICRDAGCSPVEADAAIALVVGEEDPTGRV